MKNCFSASLLFLKVGFTELRFNLLLTQQPLGLDWERCCDESVCKITAELTAALEVDRLILSFCFDIWSLLHRMIDAEHALLLRFTAKLTFNTSDLILLSDNQLLLCEPTLTGNTDDIVMLRTWFWLSSCFVRILNCCWQCSAVFSAVFDTLNEWIEPSTEFAKGQ